MLRTVLRQKQLDTRHEITGVPIGVRFKFPRLVKNELIQISQGNEAPAETVEFVEDVEQAERHAYPV